jgi:hypothetical protein
MKSLCKSKVILNDQHHLYLIEKNDPDTIWEDIPWFVRHDEIENAIWIPIPKEK